ncbi:acyl carrier protein [Streptomyces uncialis]|uniref:acyl carrier protein n=1 Tax=Streptomyces uncialis TaxID=1048205 RepID=UPI002258EF81|nr:acyl carrier protein [Streptomyces uncialis]MCX4661908.1 acyl carrier protein [Streptomyces uncialis]
MEQQEVAEHIKASLEAVLQREVVGLNADSRLFEDLSLDSMSVLELLLTLEDTIGLEIDPDELDAEVFRSFGSLSDYVAGQLRKAA